MNTNLQEYRLECERRRADALLDLDFDAFTNHDPSIDGVWNRPIPHDVMKDRYHERFGDNGWLACRRKILSRWAKYCRNRKKTPHQVCHYGAVIINALRK